MKIKNLLLLGLMTLLSMNTYAQTTYNKDGGIIYEFQGTGTNKKAYVAGVSTGKDISSKVLSIPATASDGDDNTIKVVGFLAGWVDAANDWGGNDDFDTRSIVDQLTSLTIDVTNCSANLSAANVDALVSGTNVLNLTLTGTLTAAWELPAFTTVEKLDVQALGDKVKFVSGYGTAAAKLKEINTNGADFGDTSFSGNGVLVKALGIKIAGAGAFANASKLETVSFVEGATIKNGAFTASHLTTVDLTNVTSVGMNAFGETAIASLKIPASIKKDGLIASVTTPSEASFGNMASLKKVEIENGNLESVESWFKGDAAIEEVKITSASIKAIGTCAFEHTALKDGKVDLAGATALETIGNSAFASTTLTAFTVPATVTTIAQNAFSSTALASLEIPTGSQLTTIGEGAFKSATFTTIDLSNATELTTVAGWVDAIQGSFPKNEYTSVKLAGTKLDNANFVKAQTWLENATGSLTEITLPGEITEIGGFGNTDPSKAFTKLAAITLPDKIETINYYAFLNCSELATVNIPATVKTISPNAFMNTALASIDFSAATALETIGAAAFANTKLTEVKIPATIKTLENSVFASNPDLATVDFSEATALEKITNSAFAGDTKLLVIDLDKCSKLTLVDDDAFPQNKYTSVKLNGTALAGRDADGNYYDNFSWPFNKNHIMAAAYNQEGALEMTLPAGLEKVEDAQFKQWSALKSISLPKAVTEIGKNAFEESGLTGIKIRENVATIGESAFQGCADLALVNLSEATALTEIGKKAFADCAALESIDFAGATALATIGESAFNGSSVKDVTITSSIETIGDFAFKGSVESVNFTDASALTSIGAHAFDGATFTTLDLTGATALTTVAADAFPQNEYTEVLLAGTALNDAAVNGAFSQTTILANADESLTKITFPDDYDVATFNDYDYFKNLNAIILPANATEIPDYAFQGSNITSFEVGENITRIGKYAFQASALESIDFTKATALTEIDDAAFANTASLKSVGLPKNLEVIPASAFEGSALESVKIKSHVKKISTAAFKNCAKLATVNFEDANALEQIKDQAFLGTALTTIDLSGATKLTLVDYNAFPQNVYTSVKLNGTALAGRDADGNYYDYFSYPFSKANIMANAYNQDGALEMTLPAGLETVKASQFKEWTALKEISLPKAVTLIDANAFEASGLTGIKIRENVTKIDQEAFKGCKDLATVNMSEAAALTEIGMAAFADCYFKDADGNETGLASIAIPAAVTKIGTAAFSGCALLANADFSQAAALEEIGVNAFNEYGTSKATALTVIDLSACTELATVYDSSFPKNNYTKILLNGTALTTLDPVKVWMSNWATATGDDPTCQTTLKEITLPAKVTKIPEKFLADFTGVKEVSLPKECTTIESYAFAGSGLTGIKIRSKVATIGSGAFVNCENLATANFSEATALTSIGNIAFKNTAVTEVVIPENANGDDLYLGIAAFKDSKLKSFSAKSWALGTVYDDEASSFVNGNYVSDELFMGTKLNGIAIPAVMDKIGDYAFADCKKLASVKFKHSKKLEVLEKIGDYAFRNCEALEALDLSNTKLVAIESETPFEGCTALATITFPEELLSLNSDYLFADCPIENLDAPNLKVSGELFGYYLDRDEESATVGTYVRRDKDHANTTLKTVKTAGYIPSYYAAYCTALEAVEWLGGENTGMGGLVPLPAPVPGGGMGAGWPNAYVDEWAFAYCTGLQTFTYMPGNDIVTLMVDDEAFIGCTPYVLFDTNSNYVDYVAQMHKGAAPINTTFGDVEITTIKTVQDKANANQFVAKYVNNGPRPVVIDANDAKVYSIYIDGDVAYFSACRTFDGKYVIPAQSSTTAWSYNQAGHHSHVIIKTEEAKEVNVKRLSVNDMVDGLYNKNSIGYDDVYDSQKDDDLALVQHNAMDIVGGVGQYYLYRLTNTSGMGFGFTAFTGTTIKEGQFFIACSKKPEGAGRLAAVWLDENGNVESETTGIETVESNDADNDAIYNMQGVRVEKAQKGIYIQNGKKVVVK